MGNMHRRDMLNLSATMLALFEFVRPVRAVAQDATMAEIKRSEIKPIIAARVEEIARASKEMLGVEITKKQRDELERGILADMESRGTYVFIDP